ncbi:hypothetical protein ACOBV8_18670 (plasmid) [Pseudoalteromonas espejiana]
MAVFKLFDPYINRQKRISIGEKLSQHLLDFYHENKPPVIDEYDL